MADKLPPYSPDEDGNSSTATTEVPDSSSQHESQVCVCDDPSCM